MRDNYQVASLISTHEQLHHSVHTLLTPAPQADLMLPVPNADNGGILLSAYGISFLTYAVFY